MIYVPHIEQWGPLAPALTLTLIPTLMVTLNVTEILTSSCMWFSWEAMVANSLLCQAKSLFCRVET